MDDFCERCDSLAQPEWLSWTMFTTDLEERRGRCATCKMIHDSVAAASGPSFVADFRYLFFSQRVTEDGGPLRVDVHPALAQTSSSAEKLRLQIYTTPDYHAPWKGIGSATHIDAQSLSDSCLKQVKAWIDDCLHGQGGHGNCAIESESPLPKRVLDLGSSGDIKLHISSEKETGRYVALSHCWGGTTPVMTTMSNVNEHMRKIPTPLPQTFADAVTATRVLGIRYLWIDSLCIIQDSPEDWSEQAPCMAGIYGNAHLTISADAASDSTRGFLNRPGRQFNAAVAVQYHGMAADAPIWVRERGALGYQLPFHACRVGEAPTSKLSTRGWVFQERVLSPRTLHFGESEVGWECQSLITCECSASSQRYRRTTSLLKLAQDKMDWKEVVEEYTRMDLTVAEDRLMALSGLAETRQSWNKQQYVAGMWEQDLKRFLVWRTETTRPPLKSYIAPSWSWASVTGSIDYFRFKYKDRGLSDWKVSSIDCCPSGSPFGNVKGGAHLVIRGSLIPVKLVEEDTDDWTMKPEREPSTKTPKAKIYWDSPERKESVVTQGEGCAFFVITCGPRSPQGILLKAFDSSTIAVTNTRALSIAGTSNGIVRRRSWPLRYERVAYVSAKEIIIRRSQGWSDCRPMPIEEPISDLSSWRYWTQYARNEVFALY